MALDMNTFDAALKEHYTDDRVENLVYEDNPLLALMPKMEEFGGRNLPVPIIFGNPMNRSASFAKAQAKTTTTLVDAFTLTRVKDYAFAQIDNETLEASKGHENAFLEAATTEIDGCINALTRSLAVKMYRSGYGDIGRVSSSSSTTSSTLTLSDVNDVTNFEVGMTLCFSDTQGSSVLRDGGDTVVVSAVDRSSGVLTVTPALSNIAGLTVGDYIFIDGDRQNAASPARLAVSGLEAWVPAVAPGSTPFFGVDRSVDVSRLGGQRLDASSMPIEEALITGASLVAREGGKLTHFFLDYAQFAELEKALGTKVQYVDVKVNAEIGFRGIVVNGPRGPVKVIPDQNCQSNRAWGLQLDTWKLYSLGKAVRVIDTDGLQMLRQASADGVEVRYGFYGQVGCRAPGWNINIQLAPPASV